MNNVQSLSLTMSGLLPAFYSSMEALKSALHWIFSDGSLAVATWGLVVATFLLFVDGTRKSREQNRQWNEERKRRKEEAMPSAVVEIAAKEETPLDMCFAVFNLGNNSFFIGA